MDIREVLLATTALLLLLVTGAVVRAGTPRAVRRQWERRWAEEEADRQREREAGAAAPLPAGDPVRQTPARGKARREGQ